MIFGNSFFVVTNGSGASARTSGAIFTSSVSTRTEVSADGSSWFTLDPSLSPTVGTLFPTDGSGNPLVPVNPGLSGSDFAGLNLSEIRSLYEGSAGGAGFDLSWARDADGNLVDLESASYIRIDVLSGRTQIDAVSVVPEPAAWALGLVGAGLLWLGRKKGRTA
jgi:MYXO-CTERM domain-containing protein